MKSRITREDLETSTNNDVINYVSLNHLVYTSERDLRTKYTSTAVRLLMNRVLWDDFLRNVRFNARTHEDFINAESLSAATQENIASQDNEEKTLDDSLESLKTTRNFVSTNYPAHPDDPTFNWDTYANLALAQKVMAFLNREFPGEIEGIPNSELIMEHYSQGPSGAVVIPVANWGLEGNLGVEEDKSGVSLINMYSGIDDDNNKVYIEVQVERLIITCNNTGRKVYINGGHIQHELTRNGYAYSEEKSYALGQDFLRIIKGTVPPRIEELLSYPLIYRIQDAYGEVFHGGAQAPRRPFTTRNLIGFPFKLVAEFLPRLIATAAHWARDQIVENFPTEYHFASPLVRYPAQFLAGSAIAILRLTEGAAQITNLFLSRITSPLRSFNEARAIHPALGLLSALVSVGGSVAFGILLSPLLPAVGLGGAAAWLASHTGAGGQLFVMIGERISNFIGLTVPPTSAGLAALAGAIYSMFFTPVRYLAGHLLPEKTVSDEKVIVENHDCSDSILSTEIIQNVLENSLIQNPDHRHCTIEVLDDEHHEEHHEEKETDNRFIVPEDNAWVLIDTNEAQAASSEQAESHSLIADYFAPKPPGKQ